MTITLEQQPETGTIPALRTLALELTRTCQAKCDHCYNVSGPSGTSGDMTREDWLSVLVQAAAMGVSKVQFIGGEPTLHPHLGELVTRAVDRGLQVEVFSNLITVRGALWPVLRQRGVTLATSYYSDRADEHERITKHRGSYAKTKANITKALRYRIPLRAALVHVFDGQRVTEAVAELEQLGVTAITVDRQREIGRGAADATAHDVTQLCGRCTRGRAAVDPNGNVGGCVMSLGWRTAGSVRTTALASIISGPEWAAIAAAIPQPKAGGGCLPDEDSCGPAPVVDPIIEPLLMDACNPDNDGSDCAPAETEACNPAY